MKKQTVKSIELNSKIDKCIEKIDHLIEKNNYEKESVSNGSQLEKIRQELFTMKIRYSQEFKPSFPRMIIDSWDFSDTLGVELLELNELYCKDN